MITRVMSNINDLKKRYGKPCMVVETGHYPREAVVGNQYLVGVMDRMIKNGDIAWLRIYPLEQQPIPSLANLTGISSLQTSDDEVVEVYSLSGRLLWRLPASQLGFSLGDRTSAVVVATHAATLCSIPKYTFFADIRSFRYIFTNVWAFFTS